MPDLSRTDLYLSRTDLSKIAVGHIATLGGQPVDFARSVIYDRAGLPLDAEERKGLKYTHGSAEGKDVPRLPAVFPPAVLPEGFSLSSAQDYLDLIAATPAESIPSAAERAAQKEAEATVAEVPDVSEEHDVSEAQDSETLQNAGSLAAPQGQAVPQEQEQPVPQEQAA